MTLLSKYIILFFLLTVCAVFGCNAQEKSKDLGILYKEYHKEKSKKSERDFFYAFPSSFLDFQKAYGYDDKKGPSPYYNVSREHIILFFKTTDAVEEKVFSKKLLNISKDGTWDADAVNYLQGGLRAYFFSHSRSFLALLGKSNKEELYKFWYFFSDGPHFNKDVYNKVLQVIKDNNAMKESYLRAVRQVKKDNIH